MYKIKLFNQIAASGLKTFDERYELGEDIQDEDAILVRSANLHTLTYSASLKAIARAGSGVNNIDVDTCTQKGIVVFNTPRANANAVKELVFAGLLLASRDIYHGIAWAKSQSGNANLAKDMEKQKKQYAGHELLGKSLGVIGCGAIGIQVANLALRFGMQVHAYDPYLSVESALNLSRYVKHEKRLEELLACDFITLHVPLTETTRGMLDETAFAQMKDGVKLLNFARGELVDEKALLAALASGKVATYVTDFPTPALAAHEHVIPIPHLGASTAESEENCAVKAALELRHYLQYGNIKNSVNLPDAYMDLHTAFRICCIHKNIPKMLTQITDCLAKDNINIANLLNKSKTDIAYTILDIDHEVSEVALTAIRAIDGMIRVMTYRGEAA